ncbi:hypothetical protein BS17DRAFT_159995 [Gyrodon lividus]|nr:hypothetical protein BS17DRAFT_159995 [Gyrodon lividus]
MVTFAESALPFSEGSPLLRLAAILGTTIALHVGMTPPNPPPNEDARLEVSALENTSKSFLSPIMRVLSIVPGVIEVVAIMMQLFATSEFDFASGTCAERISFNPLALVACILAFLGLGIRLWCYRALGKLFTFQMALLPKHKLIKSGPYAIVRHPSYTGGCIILGGATLGHAIRGSWARECGAIYTFWGAAWALLIAVCFVIMVERCIREDNILRVAFGEEWEGWSKKVRWRMVPYVY